MAFGGNDWLALTPEAALEPQMPICDPHHHLWDRNPGRVPYQRYLLDELLADIGGGHNVRSTVFIEVRAMYRADEPIEMRPAGEVEFAQGVAAMGASGTYGAAKPVSAIVGHADMNLGERIEPVLDALQAASPNRFRGIRHITTWDPHPEIRNSRPNQTSGMLLRSEFRAAAKVLARKGLTFDSWLYFHQIHDLAELAKAVPNLTIIMNHVGGLLRSGPYASRENEVMEAWRKAIAEIALCPNVYCKLGGLGMPMCNFDWHLRETPVGSEEVAASMAPILNYCIEEFGPNRCIFESNFPVDKVSFSYNVVWNAFKRMSKGYSASERAAMFHDNAVRVYRIKE